MTGELLCSWLNLPASPWPPDYYALLGLRRGEGTAAEIEQRVLERMELLRQHQLLQPETVTEGMNLLAQAMICLTESSSRRDYDRQLGLAPSPREEPSGKVENIPVVPVIEIPVAKKRLDPLELFSETYTLEPEPVADAILIPELVDDEPLVLAEEDDEPEIVEPVRDPERRPAPPQAERTRPRTRRELYREIVRIRRVLRVWEHLREYLEQPEKTFERRTDTVAFMSCLADLKPLLPTVSDLVGGPNQLGHLVAALARQQLVVEMFRSLLPSQREALARDCQAAHYILLERTQEIRNEIRRQTAKSFVRRVLLPMRREIVARPEWLFLAIGVLSLVIAFVRSVPK